MLKLDTVDSTNNYAMQLIDADKAAHGLTILANEQTAGKGQRGRNWAAVPGESLLMSIMLRPFYHLQQQPLFLAEVARVVAGCLSHILPEAQVRIKWPNDILINGKKAAGILIENVVRGQDWQWAVVGIGLNVRQSAFPAHLPHATSIQVETGKSLNTDTLAHAIRDSILEAFHLLEGGRDLAESESVKLAHYNEWLYHVGGMQAFLTDEGIITGTIQGMNLQGQLEIRLADGAVSQYTHGTIEWVWG